MAFLEGDAGVGKTALLEATVAEAAAAGTRVLRARRPLPRPGARSPRSTICSGRPSRGSRGSPSHSAAPWPRRCCSKRPRDPVDPRQVGLAALALLDGLPGPVLLAVDDWQWLDAASAMVLSFVLRRLEPGGAKVIATVRTGEADEAVAALVHSLPVDQALMLALGPLDVGALGRLVHARTGSWCRRPRSPVCRRRVAATR